MQIQDIYKKYRINNGLAEHMVRVGAVAWEVCDHSPLPIDKTVAVSACLLHDMGNLIKVQFEAAPELFEPEGVGYWQEVQAEMIETYGDVGSATRAIVHDIAPIPAIEKTIDEASLHKMKEIAATGTPEAKLLEYADMRVALRGVTTMHERFDDIRERYTPHLHSSAYIDELEIAAGEIERELFEGAAILPNDITETSTAKVQKQLLEFVIPTR